MPAYKTIKLKGDVDQFYLNLHFISKGRVNITTVYDDFNLTPDQALDLGTKLINHAFPFSKSGRNKND